MTPTFRAGATDLTERRHRGLHTGPVEDLPADLGGLSVEADGGLRIGAMTRIAALTTDPAVRAGWRGLAEAAEGLATPQIRARATVGGNLLQEVRCPYFRTEAFHCLKKGGAVCLARLGDHRHHAAIDLGPCAAPHPSTLAVALLAHGATVELDDGEVRDLPALLGRGDDPTATHALPPGRRLLAVRVPAPEPGERGAWVRTIHRARAEWPLVEAVVRARLDAEGRLAALAWAVGGVANRPLRFDDAARAALGLLPDDPRLDELLAPLGRPSATLPQAAYKAPLIPVTLRDALARALAAAPVPEAG